MKQIYRLLFLSLSCLFTGFGVSAQIAYSPFVDSLSQLATDSSVLLLTRQLAGDTTVTINGQITTIQSRHYLNASNEKAADFIFQKFTEYGYSPAIQTFSGSRGENVIATKTGIKFPEKEFIICGHYDNMPSGSTAPGADDNASGTVAVLEAARILSSFDFDYTIRFAAWDEEEIGLVGSYAYAQEAYNQGHQILGVLNLDMIAWDSDNDFVYTIATNDYSQAFTNDFITTNLLYQPQFSHNYYYTTASDHASFWTFGYPAMLAIEDWYDFNDYYHTPQDDINILNMEYYVAFVRAAIANLAAQAWDQRISMLHNPVVSGNSTEAREALLTVNSSHPIAQGEFAPRLYYSTDGTNFDFVLPAETSGNSFTFLIPGFELGTDVSYFFALQDSLSRMMATLPAGGKGISPAGTQAPDTFFTYMVGNILSLDECSVTTPVAIPDFQNTYNEINAVASGEIMDVNVLIDITHPRTGELRIMLKGPDETTIMLSDRNGGSGDNYTNTVFDDQAFVPITEGTPPYTGHFRPQMALEAFNGKPITGVWQLRVNDSGSGNTGTLNNWCVQFLLSDPGVGIHDHDLPFSTSLAQNYPNPAGNQTSISFTLAQASLVKLTIVNMFGQTVSEVANGRFEAGKHLLVTGLSHLAPGNYFYRLETDHATETKTMVIIR